MVILNRFKAFLKRKDIEISLRRYGIDALGAMAQGLFCSLLIGTILDTLGSQTGIEIFSTVGGYAKAMSGPAMAVAIGFALKCPPLVLFSLAAVGWASNDLGGAGGPLAVLIIAIVAAEFGKAVSKETPVDILVTPLVTIFAGVALAAAIAPPIGAGADYVGSLIKRATVLQPFWMGIIVSGAAVAGCCAQMIGFAVMSFRENRWGGLVSQGLGTSMLQMGNIVKNPRIWLPAILTSMITGPIATCVFKLEMNGAAINSGMGTCGLCGPIGIWTGWLNPSDAALADGAAAIVPTAMDWLGLVLVCFVLPAVICWALGLFFRKIGWIREGDLKLN